MAKKKGNKEESIGKKIKKARTERKVTLNHLANETGFSIDYIKILAIWIQLKDTNT